MNAIEAMSTVDDRERELAITTERGEGEGRIIYGEYARHRLYSG